MRITIATGPLFPVPTLLGGAVPRRWQGVAEEFAHQGHEVCIFARSFPGQCDDEMNRGVRYIRWGGFAQSLSIWKDLLRNFKYAATAVWKLPQADIFVTNDFWLPVFSAWLRKAVGKTVVNACRFPKGQYQMYRRAARIAAPSTAIRNAIVQQCPALESRTRVIPNPVDVQTMRPGGTQQDSSPVLLYVGRLHPEKGMHLLVEAFARVHRNHPSWRLRLVGPLKAEQGGGGPKYERELVDRSQGLPVELHGPEFEASKLALIYQSASLFCYPSVAERGEAFGIAPLEAMACGIAPVVSGLECFRDFIAPKENGWVFDHRGDNPAGALAATLDEAMGNPERRAAVAHRAAETARQFSYEKIAQRYLEDFATLLRT